MDLRAYLLAMEGIGVGSGECMHSDCVGLLVCVRWYAPPQKQTQAEKKLQRLVDYNAQLHESLNRHRLPVSQASYELIKFCSENPDPLLPSIWEQRAEMKTLSRKTLDAALLSERVVTTNRTKSLATNTVDHHLLSYQTIPVLTSAPCVLALIWLL
ncbi:hypothetical protein BC829DRAFT_106570 [Chytridium lagenaria]|nr:hypothetical protein BC829DRAFT_106570 [Chytridium lagenaria]